ncbi:hypothetical protein DSOUD_0845 [Desulfuromonas soudanensis]|uniref:Uncharacterized protein n=1 Tax=Desulfuromonas soudanensis TaxID=1603606 RepID=A0A0M4DGA3_9BACT|nr:hypothetical protein [Desulfuromonas soudanensis]ALC15632.1 hypothetical protein DSOUD_0845 [Desulfuromonas soudanensis]
MKPPYFKVTGRCDTGCSVDTWQVDRKQVRKISTSGQEYTIDRLVCPQCNAWGYVTKIEEVKG